MKRDDPVEASVHLGDVETPYVRAGEGPALILLDRAGRTGAGDPLFVTLSRSARVVCPRMPGSGSLAPWLAALMDGLGLERPVLVLRGGWKAWDEGALAAVRECGDALGPVCIVAGEVDPAGGIAAVLGGRRS
jgi:hypothetical protein